MGDVVSYVSADVGMSNAVGVVHKLLSGAPLLRWCRLGNRLARHTYKCVSGCSHARWHDKLSRMSAIKGVVRAPLGAHKSRDLISWHEVVRSKQVDGLDSEPEGVGRLGFSAWSDQISTSYGSDKKRIDLPNETSQIVGVNNMP